jgi:hypothetical protein
MDFTCAERTLEQINDGWFDSQFLSGEGGRVQDAALSSGLHDSPLEGTGFEPSVRHCQLKRPWYPRRVGGAAARVGELLCSPIMLPR